MNILIAEDMPPLQLLNAELMKRWGYDFDMASNGAEAVEYAKKNDGKSLLSHKRVMKKA